MSQTVSTADTDTDEHIQFGFHGTPSLADSGSSASSASSTSTTSSVTTDPMPRCGIDMLGQEVRIGDVVVGCSTGNALCVYYVDVSEDRTFNLVPIVRHSVSGVSSSTSSQRWQRISGKAIISRPIGKVVKLSLGTITVLL
jgi:hypothetical protein